MSQQSDFYNAVYSTAVGLGANDVQARLAAAQASEETGYGKSMVGNNLFGVKAGANYTGPTVTAGTNEEYNGQMQREQANFRAYDDFTQSVGDYLGVIQSNFPDAWNAPTFSEAVKGLNTGVYGKYATNSKYASNISAIDNKYGDVAYAAKPANVPVPTSPTDAISGAGLPEDVTAFPDQPATPVDPEFAYAANVANVPTPSFSPVDGNQTAVTAYQPTGSDQGPFSAVLGQPSSWGLNSNVAPALTPTVEGWSDMASAQPVQAPLGSVQASGILGTTPGFIADAAISAPASPAISQADADRAFFNATGANQFDPSFTAGLLGPQNPVVPTAVETVSYTSAATPDVASSRFATPAKTDRIGTLPGLSDTARMNPLTGAIDPATNTQSFMDAPAAPADLGSMPDAYAAQRGPTRGLLSADAMTVQGLAEKQLAESIANRSVPSISVPAGGIVAGNMPMEAQATVPSLASSYVAPTAVSPAEAAIAAQTSQPATAAQQAAGYGQLAQSNFSGLTNLSGGSLYDVDLSGNVVPTKPYTPPEIQAPALETVQVADQPTVAAIDGPVTTPAVEQQTQAVSTNPAAATTNTTAAATQKGPFSGLFSKQAIGGGVIGSLAAGPLGGAIGAMIGSQIAKGGLTNPFSAGGLVAPTNQIGGGIANIGSIYSGQQTPGTYSVASNGTTVTAQPGGYTTTTNKYGVTETISPTGQISHTFGGPPAPTTPDQDTAA